MPQLNTAASKARANVLGLLASGFGLFKVGSFSLAFLSKSA